jgi:hypothetical protein
VDSTTAAASGPVLSLFWFFRRALHHIQHDLLGSGSLDPCIEDRYRCPQSGP